MPETDARTVPQNISDLHDAWRKWSSIWNTTNLSAGILSTATATIVAANTAHHFLPRGCSTTLAVIAAVLTFVVGTLSAQVKGASFETAGRELEKAMFLYRNDASVTVSDLGKAAARGIDILNSSKKP